MYQPLTILPITLTLLSTAWEHSLKHNHVTPFAEKAWGCGLRKVCLAPGWNLGTCISGGSSSGENSSLCWTVFVKHCGLCWTPAFLRVDWNFWSLEGTHVITSQIKTLSAESLNKLSQQITFHVCCHSLLLEELSKSYVTPMGEESESLCLISPGLQLMYLFPFPL